jgi:hypothetical protein
MTGARELVCPGCSRVFGRPVEMTLICEDLHVTYVPICIECSCGATWATRNPYVRAVQCAEPKE